LIGAFRPHAARSSPLARPDLHLTEDQLQAKRKELEEANKALGTRTAATTREGLAVLTP
jgi:hypothetical protein